MKKEYINPDLEVVMLKMNQQLLAGSGEVMGTDPTPVSPGSSDAPGFVEIDELDILKNF